MIPVPASVISRHDTLAIVSANTTRFIIASI